MSLNISLGVLPSKGYHHFHNSCHLWISWGICTTKTLAVLFIMRQGNNKTEFIVNVLEKLENQKKSGQTALAKQVAENLTIIDHRKKFVRMACCRFCTIIVLLLDNELHLLYSWISWFLWVTHSKFKDQVPAGHGY